MITRSFQRCGDVVDRPAEKLALASVADPIATAEADSYIAGLGEFEQIAVARVPSHSQIAASEAGRGTCSVVRIRWMRVGPRVIPGGSLTDRAPKSSIEICLGECLGPRSRKKASS